VPDGPWCRRVRVRSISRQEANPSRMASGGADPPRFAPPHDTGTDARRTADGSVPVDTTAPPPQVASSLLDPTAAATVAGDSGASPGNASRRAEQSAVSELSTLVRTLAASVRELRADVTTLRAPTGTLSMSTASGPRPTDPTPANSPAPRDRPRSRRSAASTSPLASLSGGRDRIPTPAPCGPPVTTSRQGTPAAATAAAATAPDPRAAAPTRAEAPARGSLVGQL